MAVGVGGVDGWVCVMEPYVMVAARLMAVGGGGCRWLGMRGGGCRWLWIANGCEMKSRGFTKKAIWGCRGFTLTKLKRRHLRENERKKKRN
ncbi:hypothetical protein WN944_028757 [Citrus x changshan-huyou]|uniref:Uncharacterized protein n=1 Tax=Citrus x changshan-huyou TaxID=2935761 RepID=A0AAP0LK06_9ROSI